MTAPQTRLAHIGRHAPPADWHIAAHAHSQCEMIVVVSGHEEVAVRGLRLRAVAGDVLLFPPHVPHEEWSEARDPLRSYFLGFAAGREADDWPLHSADLEGRLRLLAAWLHAERDASVHPADRATNEAFFQAFIQEYRRLIRRDEAPLAASIRAFVRSNIGAPLTVGQLAAHAGMSKFHFIRRYRQLTGVSPMEDVRRLRVSCARDLILTGNLPLKAIVRLAGIGNDISLYRLFRRHLDMTPGQFRIKPSPTRRAEQPAAGSRPARRAAAAAAATTTPAAVPRAKPRRTGG